MPAQFTPSDVRAFLDNITIDSATGCWLWGGAFTTSGYGDWYFHGRRMRANRLAFEMAFGPIPKGMFVCHACDNRACVRNDDEGWYEVNGILRPRRGHLWLGTHAENQADKIAKGRAARGVLNGSCTHPERRPRGEENARTKLTAACVLDIRKRYAEGGITQRELAEAFGVDVSAIGRIIRRERWMHI